MRHISSTYNNICSCFIIILVKWKLKRNAYFKVYYKFQLKTIAIFAYERLIKVPFIEVIELRDIPILQAIRFYLCISKIIFLLVISAPIN